MASYPEITILPRVTFTMVFPYGLKDRKNYFIMHDSGTIEVFRAGQTDHLSHFPGLNRNDYTFEEYRKLTDLLYFVPPKKSDSMDELRSWFKRQAWNDGVIKVTEEAPEMTEADWLRLEKYIR